MVWAFAVGVAVLVGAYLLVPFVDPTASWGNSVAPALAGFAAAWLAPRARVAVAMSVPIPPTAVLVVAQAYCEMTGGRCDHVGEAGIVFFAFVFLVFNVALCELGASVAVVARSQWFRRPDPPRPST